MAAEATAPSFDVVHAETLRYFPDVVAELGGDAEALLRDCGIAPSWLAQGDSHIGYRLIVDLLERAAATLQCPDFGLRLAMLQGDGSVFGPMGVVMRNSNTLGDALDYVEKHSHAHSLAARIRLDRDPKSGSVFVGHDVLWTACRTSLRRWNSSCCLPI